MNYTKLISEMQQLHRNECRSKMEQSKWNRFPFDAAYAGQNEAIETIMQEDRSLLCSHTGSGKCLSGGHKIFGSDKIKNIEDIKETEEILCFVDDKLQSQDVLKTFQYQNQNVIKIKTHCGFTIEGTYNHKILQFNKNGEYQWKSLLDLNVGNVVPIIHTEVKGEYQTIDWIPSFKGTWQAEEYQFLPEVLNEQLAWLLGIYTADGNASYYSYGAHDWSVQISKRDMHVVVDIKNLLDFYKVKYKHTKRKGVRVASKHFTQFVSICGRVSHEKHTPLVIFKSPVSVRVSYLHALFTGDGWISKNEIGYASVSKQLVEDIQILLLSLDILSQIRYKAVKYNGNIIDSWNLTVVADSYRTFQNLIGEFATQSKYSLDELVKRDRNTNIVVIPNIEFRISRLWEKYKRATRGIKYKGEKQRWSNLVNMWKRKIRRPSYSSLKRFLEYVERYIIKDEDYVFLKRMADQDIVFFDYIEDVTFEGTKTVYDLNVPNTESYIANGFVSHNSAVFLTAAHELEMPTLVIEPRKFLQVQLQEYFNDFVLFGKSEYKCFYADSAAHAPCAKVYTRDKQKYFTVLNRYTREIDEKSYPCANCEYVHARTEARKRLSESGVLIVNMGNFWMWRNSAKFIIVDEADEFFRSISSGIGLYAVTTKDIDETDEDTTINLLKNEEEGTENKITTIKEKEVIDIRDAKKLNALNNHLEKIHFFRRNNEECFYYTKKTTKQVYVELQPDKISVLVDRLFGGKKLCLVTATPSAFV